MAKAVVTFATYRGGQLISRDSVTHDIVKVGRDPKSHLRVDDEAASRMHAVIEVAGPGEITLIDLGNDPGTYVNGERINKCRLRVGDRIDIGSTQLVLESVEPEGAGAGRFEARQALGAAVRANTTQQGLDPVHANAQEQFWSGGYPAQEPAAAQAFAAPAPAAYAAQAVPAPAAFSQGHGGRGHGSQGHGSHGHGGGGNYTYAMVKSGPDVSPDEVELPHVQAAEVMILWGTNVLHVAHLAPPRNFYVGEEQTKAFTSDFFIPSEKLGTSRLPVVIGDQTTIAVVIPPGAVGEVEGADHSRLTLDQARMYAQPCSELPGGHQLPLAAGAKARIQLGDIVFQVAAVSAGKPVAHGLAGGVDWNVMLYFGLSFLSVGGLIAAMAFFVPPLGLSDDEGIDQDQLYLIQQYLKAAAEKELEEEETEQVAETDADNKEGGTGTRAKGEEGEMGKKESTATNKRYAVQGPQDNQDPHLARQAALREAMEFGMIGLLNTGAAGDPNAPTAPWGRDTSLGTDEVSAMGNMWGDEIGDAFGQGGLGLSGIGEGGGGRGEGIGLGNVGTLGHGAGTGTGQGFGSGHGRLGGSHRTKSPQVRMGATQVSGRLPPEVIQRIVRQNYGRFRLCYEQGLGRNPNLEGRVTVRFVIGRDGSVSNVSNGGSDLPDSSVVQCVVRAFYGLSFPQPEGGIVTVVYPIMLQPG
jgi:pSer/pThr/pTyr-binding forkhead associated (FHA) protein